MLSSVVGRRSGTDERLAADRFLWPAFLASPNPSLFFLSSVSSSLLSKAGSSRQKPPLPGSSLERAILMKHLFSDRLCRIEFWTTRKSIFFSYSYRAFLPVSTAKVRYRWNLKKFNRRWIKFYPRCRNNLLVLSYSSFVLKRKHRENSLKERVLHDHFTLIETIYRLLQNKLVHWGFCLSYSFSLKSIYELIIENETKLAVKLSYRHAIRKFKYAIGWLTDGQPIKCQSSSREKKRTETLAPIARIRIQSKPMKYGQWSTPLPPPPSPRSVHRKFVFVVSFLIH